MARFVWKFAVFAMLAIVLVAALADLLLDLFGRETISDWLRANPEWFWWPAGFIVLGLIFLALHLFVLPEWFGGMED